jgi:[ribosomal protein S5]-alanine N-acetyltransferase
MTAPGGAPARVLETGRLVLRRFTADDAPFIVELLNDPGWIRFIGDRGVRTAGDARAYLEKGPVAMYARDGFGLYLTALKDGGAPIGMCGLIRREGLDDVDIGFAFLPAFRSQGYALESARAVMVHAREDYGIGRVVAITSRDNHASIRVLEKIGLRFERMVRLPKDEEEVMLFGCDTPTRRQAMKLTQLHDRLLGNWTGSNRLWTAPPPVAPAVCATALAVTPVAGGKFLAFAYAWSFEGAAQEGLIVLGNDNDAGTASAAFVDSFHMSGEVMHCTGSVDAGGAVSVLGHYAAPPGPDWGWRIAVSQAGKSDLRIAMYNISPDGTEYPAVQADYRRSK